MSGEGAVFFLFYFPHCIFDLFCVYRSNLGKHSFMLYLN
jgi:hypothetical protein